MALADIITHDLRLLLDCYQVVTKWRWGEQDYSIRRLYDLPNDIVARKEQKALQV